MPRHCATITTPSGRRWTVCGDGVKRCSVDGCAEVSEYLCDFVPRSRTCDAPLCDAHRVPQGSGRDYCPRHAIQPRTLTLGLEGM